MRGNYRKGKEACAGADLGAKARARARARAIDVFGNISRSAAKAIATMDRRNGIRPAIFYVVC